jgi:uroporphyrinogen-III decarboxylase
MNKREIITLLSFLTNKSFLAQVFKAALAEFATYPVNLDGLGRIIAAVIGQPDRPPILAQIHEHAMHLTRTPASLFWHNARTFVEAEVLVFRYYGIDLELPLHDIYNIEAEALGQRLIYGEKSMPSIDPTEPLIKIPSDLLRLKPPNPYTSGRMPWVLEWTSLLPRVSNLPFPMGLFCAPFSLACGIRSYTALIRDLKREPNFARDLFIFLVDEVIYPYINAMALTSGAKIALGADAWACFPNLTPEMVEEWVVPYVNRLKSKCRERGIRLIVAASGDYCEERVERLDSQMLLKCLRAASKVMGAPVGFIGMGIGHEWDLSIIQRYAWDHQNKFYGKMPIIGGINARLLRDGPSEKLVEVVKRYIHILGREGRFFIFLANIPADTPPEHVHTVVKAVNTYGSYPIPANLDRVAYQYPVIEPFEDWLRRQ